jgi:hypothetical protein
VFWRTGGLLLGSLVLFAAALSRVQVYRRTQQRPAAELAIGLTWLACAMAVYCPPIYTWLDRVVFRRPNTSELVGHLGIAFSAAAAVGMVVAMSPTASTAFRWWRRVFLAVTALAMTLTFALHRYPVETLDFTTRYGSSDAVRLYWAVFLAYVSITLIHLVVLCFRSGQGTDRWLRLGLRIVGSGASLGLLYLAHWAAYLIARSQHRALPRFLMDSAPGVAVAAGMVIVIGTLTPRAGRALEVRRQLHRLGPVWSYLTSLYPQACTEPSAEETPPLRVYRLLIEIRDSLVIAHIRGDDKRDVVLHDLAAVPTHATIDLYAEVKQLGRVGRLHHLDRRTSLEARRRSDRALAR